MIAQQSFAFGSFVLVPARQLLMESGKPVRIGSRALDLLACLLERPGEVVTKRQLIDQVWSTTVVDESNLKVNMGLLRRALGERLDSPQFIATVSGRGYRFIAPVQIRPFACPPLVLSPVPASCEGGLPPRSSRIVGRAPEMAAIHGALRTSRLVSVVGMGGAGKTALAVAVASHLREEGVVRPNYVDLSRVSRGEDVPLTLMAALSDTPPSDSEPEVLLLIDTCEHVLASVGYACHVVLNQTKRVRILATSRHVLGVPGERVEWIGPLDLPPPEARRAVDVLKYSAPDLLVERAFQKTGFKLDDTSAPAVAGICRKLDGLPLAIELVAGRLGERGADAVLHELNGQLRTLAQEGTRVPSRQRTLLSTLEWSYSLLTLSEAAVLRSVSIFDGSFDIDSALAVVAHHGLSVAATYDAISGLRSKSMVELDQVDGELRYRLLDMVQEFAFQKLFAQGELIRLPHHQFPVPQDGPRNEPSGSPPHRRPTSASHGPDRRRTLRRATDENDLDKGALTSGTCVNLGSR